MAEYGPSPLLGTAIALPLLAIIAVCLRFYVRLGVRHTYIGVDDWLVLCSVILVCGHGALQILGVTIGSIGQDDIPIEHRDRSRIATQQKIKQAILIMEKVEYTTIKLSVLFLYRRIFGARRTFRRTADALSVLIVVWGVVFLFLEIFVCTSDSATNLTCAAQEWTLLWFAITDVLGDILVLSLPYPYLRNLQMSKSEKIGLTAIFALGMLSTITGVVRLGYVAKFFYAYFHPEFHNDTESAPDLWTTVEVSTGVIAACLPPLGALLRKVPAPRRVLQSIRQSVHYSGRSRDLHSGRSRDQYSGRSRDHYSGRSQYKDDYGVEMLESDHSPVDGRFTPQLPDPHREEPAGIEMWWEEGVKNAAGWRRAA